MGHASKRFEENFKENRSFKNLKTVQRASKLLEEAKSVTILSNCIRCIKTHCFALVANELVGNALLCMNVDEIGWKWFNLIMELALVRSVMAAQNKFPMFVD